jgi:hypothetical protein
VTEFGERRFFDHHVLYVAAQPLPGVALPSPCLAGLLITDDELRAVRTFGPSRLLARLGQAILYVHSNVRDAQLYVDGRFIGPLDALAAGVALEPGVHRLELRREDYFSTYREVQIARASRKTLAIDMAIILP